MKRAKIVATLGPASADRAVVRALIDAGMNVARLNLSHGDSEHHRTTVATVRAEAERAGAAVAILADLAGPKIRVGRMAGGAVDLVAGSRVTITTNDILGTADTISTTYRELADDVRPGDPILLDDGLLRLEVEEVRGREVSTRVVVGGPLKDRKGMNLPGTKLSTPALTDKDKADLSYARELGVDYFALSFVRTPADLVEAKALAGDTPVIAKVEKPEAIENLDAILEAADGVMVARGDLGVELGDEKVPLVQKRILGHRAVRAKPTITATQMLDSMIVNPRPTRAEASDVANAVLDGTDAVMLSGETSVGKYPVESVRTMAAIIDEVEGSALYSTGLASRAEPERSGSFSEAIADAAVEAAQSRKLAAIAVYSESGRSAWLVSAYRPAASIICFSRHDAVLNRLALCWGIKPLHGDWVRGVDGVVGQAERELIVHGLVRPGDEIAVTFGMVLGDEPFQTNMMKLWKVRGAV